MSINVQDNIKQSSVQNILTIDQTSFGRAFILKYSLIVHHNVAVCATNDTHFTLDSAFNAPLFFLSGGIASFEKCHVYVSAISTRVHWY